MSCEKCLDMFSIDGAEPDCWEGGCKAGIDGLIEDDIRVLGLRNKLITLKELIDPATVLRLYGATREDVEMIAAIEEELKITDEGNGE